MGIAALNPSYELVIQGGTALLGSPFRPLRVGWCVVVGAIAELSVAVPEEELRIVSFWSGPAKGRAV